MHKNQTFYLLALFPERMQYYLSTCIAEGFCDLGIPFNTNIEELELNASKIEEISVQNADVCIVDVSGVDLDTIKQKETQEHLRQIPNKHKYFISLSDNNSDFYLADEDAILFATSESAFIKRPGKRTSWAFGLSKKILKNVEKRQKTSKNNEIILCNFRPSLNQHVRQSLDLALIPQLENHFTIDREQDKKAGRFQEQYYDKLASSLGCLTYGGTFADDISQNPYLSKNPFFMKPEGSAVIPSDFEYTKETVIVRWDSWRFWETMAMGSLNICINLDKYGCMLPEMPTNWEHYIGLDLDNLQHDIERMLDEKDRLPQIAAAGRNWALEHYTPKATALRFIETLNNFDIKD